jgi:glycine hydroxymethyltransferase
MAAYAALIQPGDTVLAMGLPHGGHLTHGSKVNFSGKWFHTVAYSVDAETELIDYDEVRDLAQAHRPKLVICGATAYPRLIDFARFREIADEVGAYLMVDAAHFIGLVAGRAVPSPVQHADVVSCTTHKVLRGPRGGMILCREELAQRIDKAVFPFSQGGPLMHAVAAKAVALREAALPEFQGYAQQVVKNSQALAAGLAAEGMRPVSGGTDTHLALIDLRDTGVTGRDAEARCDLAKITLNKNAVPYDPEKPAVASGIRVGTPSVTTQGMREGEMRRIAGLIALAVGADPETVTGLARLHEVADEVTALVNEFPAYAPTGVPA